MSKETLRAQIIARLQADLDLQLGAARLAHDEAISEESRAENKYDTHSQEAAYLAEGQSRLVREVADSIALYQSLPLPGFTAGSAASVGALLEVGRPGRSTWYFLGPRAGGLELALPDGREVLVVTPASPLGRQLNGRRTGEAVELPGRRGPASDRILRIE